MKERPILFSGEMVRALLAGMKTQTRRVIKPSPGYVQQMRGGHWESSIDGGFDQNVNDLVCPYGVPGDRLWVRETFFDVRRYKSAPLFAAVETHFIYRADYEYRENQGRRVIGCHKWRPSIFMPRSASRITLEIVRVGVERLQEITREDAIEEGVDWHKCPSFQTAEQMERMITGRGCATTIDYIGGYKRLWESINNEPLTSWDANPWVWVVEFKRVLP